MNDGGLPGFIDATNSRTVGICNFFQMLRTAVSPENDLIFLDCSGKNNFTSDWQVHNGLKISHGTKFAILLRFRNDSGETFAMIVPEIPGEIEIQVPILEFLRTRATLLDLSAA